jgi:type 1 glutamine amidotransferase
MAAGPLAKPLKETKMARIKIFVLALPLTLVLVASPAIPQNAQSDAETAAALLRPPSIPGQNLNGMRVYLRGGLKTHFHGQHDYPQFMADWSKILTEHGAVVDGSFHAPTAAELEGIDVLVMYKGDAGYMTAEEKSALDAFVRRGGGIVSIHDALCGPDPEDYATYLGGAKKHGEINFTLDAPVPYTIAALDHPIMQGMTELVLYDEAFYKLTWSAVGRIEVLASAVIADTPVARQAGFAGQSVPQIWTYENTRNGGKPARAFAWMQGHNYENMKNFQIENMLLRAIAWTGHRPVNELLEYEGASRAPGVPVQTAPTRAPQRN